jgi:two-component system response regulator YesN
LAKGDLSPISDLLEAHLFPEICFCLDGIAEVRCHVTTEQILAGDVLIVPPQVWHSRPGPHFVEMPPSRASSRLLWLRSFPYGAVVNLCETRQGEHRGTLQRLFLQRQIHPCVERLIEEMVSEEAGHEAMAACHLVEALTYVARAIDVNDGDGVLSVQETLADASGERGAAGLARRFIRENFDSRLDLGAIARAVGTGKSQLCREFRREYDITVMDYLTRVRIDAARRLLQSRLKVADVARFVGFEDPYHFSRVFKRFVGQSPKQFAGGE